MSALFIDDVAKKRAHDIALFAARPENWYRSGESTWSPGERSEYVATFQSYRCVFTFTVMRGGLYRHLSVSVPRRRPGALPHPFALFAIASLFGFTGGKTEDAVAVDPPIVGPGDDWLILPQMDVPCLLVVQKIGPVPHG